MKNPKTIVNESLLETLQRIDDDLFKNKPNWLIVKGKKWRIFVIKDVYVKIKRRYYFNLKTKRYVSLLDEYFQIEKHQHFNQQYKTSIINKIVSSKSSYKEIGTKTNVILSKSTIHRIIKKTVIDENKPFSNLENVENNNKIIINVDDSFNSLLFKDDINKSQFRILNFYQEGENKRKINEITAVLIRQLGSPVDLDSKTNEIANEILQSKYGYKNNKKIVVCGDGARFIQTLANNLNAEIVLDKWHCFKLVSTVFNSKNLSKDQINNKEIKEVKKDTKYKLYNVLKNADVKSAITIVCDGLILLKDLELKENKIKDIFYLKKYLERHNKGIENWNTGLVKSVFAESKVQQYVKSYFGSFGRIYSNEIFVKLLSVKCCVYNLS